MQHGTKIRTAKQITFIRSVFWLGLTAFGGPQLHLPHFKRRLVDKHRFISAEELAEINAFCSILPGPSTTQTITSIGMKLGGPLLAILALTAWAIPGAILMSIIALSPKFLGSNELRFMQPMVAAFLVYAVLSMFPWIKRSNINYLIFIICGIAGFAFNTPLIFPLGVLLGGIASAFLNQYELSTIPKHPQKPIIWKNLIAVGGLFLFFGGIGLLLSHNEQFLDIAKPIVLLENTYRIGALSFGGGNTMAAMSYEQYVQYHPRLTNEEFNTGLGLLQALPGPNFNFAIYLNTLAMKNYHFNFLGQLSGSIIGLVAIFLPGTLMVFFAYPIWNTLAHYRKIRLALDGIFAASVGFILTACLLINQHFIQQQIHQISTHPNWMNATNIVIFSLSLLALYTKKVHTPFIVLFAILVGWLMPI
ncbi:MAG: hypothetical protein RLZZ252_1340 [Bacteroidota bacterium]|jgi:chromate transporter